VQREWYQMAKNINNLKKERKEKRKQKENPNKK
jgi:hypothetical protein